MKRFLSLPLLGSTAVGAAVGDTVSRLLQLRDL